MLRTLFGVQTNAKKRDAALEEVRTAVEDLVLSGGHAAELLPRSPDVMQAQACSQHALHRTCIASAFWKWDLVHQLGMVYGRWWNNIQTVVTNMLSPKELALVTLLVPAQGILRLQTEFYQGDKR